MIDVQYTGKAAILRGKNTKSGYGKRKRGDRLRIDPRDFDDAIFVKA